MKAREAKKRKIQADPKGKHRALEVECTAGYCTTMQEE